MSRGYTDISSSELEDLRSVISEKQAVRCNLADTRCVVSWTGATPQAIIDLGCTVRSESEAISYYTNSTNGWGNEPE